MATRVKQKAEARKQAKAEAMPNAYLHGLDMSARRVRVIADKIRGQSLAWAMDYLRTEGRGAAKHLRSVLDSAMANADGRGLNVDNLVVSDVIVDKGALRKRFMPRAQGRATKIRKQSSHIRVRLSAVN